ncbi:MAG: hypothetical protein RLZZ211_1497 [Bacteroidota bacterium]|jgi:hypothetical protein
MYAIDCIRVSKKDKQLVVDKIEKVLSVQLKVNKLRAFKVFLFLLFLALIEIGTSRNKRFFEPIKIRVFRIR